MPKDPFDNTLYLTQWALDKAWKIAVKVAGVTDWSITNRDHPEREHQVELMQIEIAKMILDNLGKTEDLKR